MPSWLPEAVRVALAIGLGSVIGRELRRRFAHKMAMAEMDEVQAELVRDSGDGIAKRIRTVPPRPKPLWLRRWERKMAGLGRLGDRKVSQLREAKR